MRCRRPRAGGVPALWNTSVVFFPFALLAGYAFSHVLPPRRPSSPLATSASLLQRWWARPGGDPAPLGGASNVGSVTALLAYPPRHRARASRASWWRPASGSW